MGRKSLANERRAQCLDAYETCIVRHGFAGATLDLVATTAGVHRTIIRHYFGGRDGLIDALIERLRARYAARYHYDDTEARADVRIERALASMFSTNVDGPRMDDRVFDALYASSSSDERVSAFLREFYADASRRLIRLLRLAYPMASTADIHDVSANVIALAVGHSILDTIEPVRARAKRLLRSARRAIESLAVTTSEVPRVGRARRNSRLG